MNLQMAHIPLARIAIPLIAGIIISLLFEVGINNLFFFSACVALIATASILHRIHLNYNHRWLFGLLISLFFVFVGIKLCEQHKQLNRSNHFGNYAHPEGSALIRITEPVSEKENSFMLKGVVNSIFYNDTIIDVSGNIILYMQKDDKVSELNYGDIIITENNFQRVNPSSNPHEFNYKKFLEYNNIFHQSYRRSEEWMHTGINNGNFLLKKAHQIRNIALEIFQNNNISGKEYAVVSALVLGHRDYLDDELQQGFAGAGAMHVLCVSGLHVGIIFIILNTVFGFLSKIKGGIIIKAILIIVLIWLYASITGLSPSVQRASTMFSFVAIGGSFKRKTNIYNTLAASALLLIIIDPYIITQIGFQLSYIAVIGIVALQPLLYKKIIFKNKLLDKAWALITVSIAAQLATGAIGLYYFNQFPNYFLLTNLIVIPLASLIIYTALCLIILSPLPTISSFIGEFLSELLKIMHKAVTAIESLPGSVSSDVYINLPETLLLITLIIIFSSALILRRKILIKSSFIILLMLLSSFSYRSIQNSNTNMFVVYDINYATAIDFISGNTGTFISCDELKQNPKKISFHINANRLRKGIKEIAKETAPGELCTHISENIAIVDNLILFQNRKFLILSPESKLIYTDKAMKIDYLIISQNPNDKPEFITKNLIPEIIILDSSNKGYIINKWEEFCKNNNIDFWSVKQQGAFVSNF